MIFGAMLLFFQGPAQLVSSFDIHFSSDSYDLTIDNKQKIDSVIKSLSNIPGAYSVSVYGHTDNEGDLSYNKKLSLERATHVKAYLSTKGFNSKHISSNAYAYTKPAASNVNEDGKSKNRRVNIKVYAVEPDLSKVFSSGSKTQTYSVTASEGGKFKYESGSEITVPPNAFETLDGKSVNGKVTIKYTEYRTQLDFIKSGIPMSFYNGKKELVQFNSGGMFKIEASIGNEQLKLKAKTDLKINFAKTQNLPELKFFGYDTLHGNWVQDNHNLTASSTIKTTVGFSNFVTVNDWINKFRIVKKINQKDSCILYPCTGTIFAAKKGLELASSKTLINVNRAKIYFIDVPDPRNKIPYYNLKIFSYGSNDVEFQLIPNEEESVFEEFKNYHWVYEGNKKHPFKKEWENILWLRIKVDYMKGNEFSMTFYSNGTEFTITVKAKYKPKGWSTQEVYAAHSKNKNVNLDRVLEQHQKLGEFDRFFDGYVFNNRFVSGNSFQADCLDSLFCFYSYNKQWMDFKTGEDRLGFKEWFDYFNAHKELMKIRYTKLLSSKNIVALECLAQEEKMYAEAKAQRRKQYIADSTNNAGHSMQMNTLYSQFAELSISSLGVWNCDQIQRLKEPVYVKKTYKSSTGKKIEPTIIYIIDKEVNGTLTYNGAYNMSPYYFAISSKSQNTLIAFDMNNKAYICRADKMKNHADPENTSEIILEALSKPDEQVSTILK